MKKVGICGGPEAFRRFLHKAVPEAKLIVFGNFESALKAAATDEYEALFILPQTENALVLTLSQDAFGLAAQLKQAGQKLYVECYDAGDYASRQLFGFIADSNKRGLYDEYAVWNGKILQMRRSSYLPGRARAEDTLVTVENCLGSHAPVIQGTTRFPLIVRSGSFVCAAAALSYFDRLSMLPHERWKALLCGLFSDLLGADADAVERAFECVYPAIGLSRGKDMQEAVLRAVNWHLDAGVMPDRSGKSGIYEMIRSMDLSVRANERVDVVMLTAALFVTAGRHFRDKDLYARGTALADYGFDRGAQIEGGANDGLFRWFIDPLVGSPTVYSSDNGRDAMALKQLYKVTGDKKYLDRLLRQGEMFLRWFGGGPFFKRTSFSLDEYDVETLKASEEPSNSPVFYEGPVIAMACLYDLTGDSKWYEQVKRTADGLVKAYPAYKKDYSPLTYNFLFSRLLTVLIAAQETGCGDYSDTINETVDFFYGLQDEEGGIADYALVDEGKSLSHPEFAISMGKDHDKICDFLYCVNNILGACSLAKRMTRPLRADIQKLTAIGEKLLSFVLRTQIRDADHRIDGGWMRAFDMAGREYYGVNRDKDWGPYCIMGGWVMAFIPLILLGEMGEESIYSVHPTSS
ncbi:MAG: hypothetical protein IJM56_04985 [Clostridia bacterium]|nr:hypothetical protein [Clostridia bacterium]